MKELIVLVGPCGSGKSTLAKKEFPNHYYINQDSQGKQGHLETFNKALDESANVVVDRMNFSVEQRARYTTPAKAKGYSVRIIVLHESRETCMNRMLARQGHETITNQEHASSALNTFFGKYERPTEVEGVLEFRYPSGDKPLTLWCDVDGSVADCEHRRHFVNPPEGQKKDWKSFFEAMVYDPPIVPIVSIVAALGASMHVIYCSGRSETYKKQTLEWLLRHHAYGIKFDLYMRPRNDSRRDDIVKEVLLDFEVLTRYRVFACLDDRDQVVRMLRGRGLTVLQVADGAF